MDSNIQDFLQGKKFAVVGVSRNQKKFGNAIHTELKGRGYEVFIVHPEAQEIDGEKCYPSLSALPGKVDGVVICVSPRHTEQVMRDAVQAGIQKMWIQQGAQPANVTALANELGVQPVMGKCILMYAQPVGSIHGWHRTFARIFGQL
jgi:uncharacterized protein